ncbi:hypothetical protein GMDG_08315 [Pseudogymnoascus destructans 20631-21]|uniref:Uncharacterized protein n=1 Tax=Pseudogymnoascus destructans (strain ATCC MYA-4855 / 20631-21) TaxID=658429 RepID=L8G3F7_PSED2|nr:hypothetical protein GMDG_08315 [Pseudogymnoascus destructans 20631-21]
MAPMKLQKRKSDDDMNGGTRSKKNKTENLTPQTLCDAVGSELENNPDVAARLSSATLVKDFDTRIEDKNTTSIVCIGETTTSKVQNDTIDDGLSGTISVDSLDIGDNYWIVEELKEKLKEVMKDVENTKLEEKLALEVLHKVTKEVPIWKHHISAVNN